VRLDRFEERVDSPRFHSHSDEPAVLRLGACWGPSSRGAAISLSASVLADLLGGRRAYGGGAVAPDWAMDSDLLRIDVAHGLGAFSLDAVLL
jgi:hypothetical protein